MNAGPPRPAHFAVRQPPASGEYGRVYGRLTGDTEGLRLKGQGSSGRGSISPPEISFTRHPSDSLAAGHLESARVGSSHVMKTVGTTHADAITRRTLGRAGSHPETALWVPPRGARVRASTADRWETGKGDGKPHFPRWCPTAWPTAHLLPRLGDISATGEGRRRLPQRKRRWRCSGPIRHGASSLSAQG